MQVQLKTGQGEHVIGRQGLPGIAAHKLRTYLDLLPLKFYRGYRGTPWGVSWLPSGLGGRLKESSPDLVHLHWGCCGFVPLTAVADIRQPVVWTMHDSWVFTGGCNIPGDCLRYREGCGCCPQLGSASRQDLSNWELRRKARVWRHTELTMVAPSRWMAECARSSSLLRGTRIEVIPNGLDLGRYRPINKGTARDLLGLPRGKKLVLFGATVVADRNKGFQLLRRAVAGMDSDWRDRVNMVVFGASSPSDLEGTGVTLHDLGRLHDDVSLQLAYGAADVICVPSLQESFGQTATEAMACATPVVAFAATGLLDIVDHGVNGYLATPYDCEDLAAGLKWALGGEVDPLALGRAAREKAEREFSMEIVARKHLALYRELLASRLDSKGE